MHNPLAIPYLAETQETAQITAKFHLWFADETVGELELTTRAAPIVAQLTEQVENLTDDDLEAVRELASAAYRERTRRERTRCAANKPAAKLAS